MNEEYDACGTECDPHVACYMNYTDKEIDAALKHIITDELGISENDYDPKKNLSDFAADTLDVIEIIMACEEEFDITMCESDCEETNCEIPKIKELIIKQLGERYKKGE